MKSASEIVEEHRNKEIDVLREYIKSVGGDGLVCPGECGCGIDDLITCGVSIPDELDECYPAKSKLGMWEGIKGPVFYKIEEATDETETDPTG